MELMSLHEPVISIPDVIENVNRHRPHLAVCLPKPLNDALQNIKGVRLCRVDLVALAPNIPEYVKLLQNVHNHFAYQFLVILKVNCVVLDLCESTLYDLLKIVVVGHRQILSNSEVVAVKV